MKTSIFTLLLVISLTISYLPAPSSAQNPIFLNETFDSGFLQVSNKFKIFYWLFESRNEPSTDPLLVWINGGPGCSSEIAALYENGPYVVTYDQQFGTARLTSNPYSWNQLVNILYLDQPLGTGFSQSQFYETNETSIANDFLATFKEFMAQYPEYRGRTVFLGGSSYASHYIPLMAQLLQSSIPEPLDVNLGGVLMGNGWIDPANQYGSMAEFAFQNQLIGSLKYNTLKAAFIVCKGLIQQGRYGEAVTACSTTQNQLFGGNPPNFNYYNIKQPFVAPNGYNLSAADAFLAKNSAKLILGVIGLNWSECNATVNSYLTDDRILNYTNVVADLLNVGVKILVYNGDLDVVANWLGGQYWTGNVTWADQNSFNSQQYKEITGFGAYKAFSNFVYYRVYNAGHLVAKDQPAAALDMFARFIKGWKKEGEDNTYEKDIISS